ncbi:MAG: TetR family transcriptional regulator [Nocardioides sp.]|nr:TetR family transcriptional regulator [Nocardioides sp.]
MPSPQGPAEPGNDAVAGAREQRKQTTRRGLEDAALRLFARDGFDATTVEAITEEAGVSPRTFFRYFASKEQVLSPERELRQALLREAVLAAADRGLPDLDVAVEALASIAAIFEPEREAMKLRRRAAASSVTLRGRLQDVLHSWQLALTAALAERRESQDTDLQAEIAGAVAITLWQDAVQRWATDTEDALDLAAHLRAARSALGCRPRLG